MWPFNKKKQPVKENPRVKGCKHDWEIVSICQWLIRTYEQQYSIPFGYYDDPDKPIGWRILERPRIVGASAIRKVCLNCGECIDEIAEASDCIHAQWDEEDQRKELAEKLWDECKGE